MEDIIRSRHYIYINPNDLDFNLEEKHDIKFNTIKKFHRNNYENNEQCKYYGYNDIVELLTKYDVELRYLFLSINPNYPALLADIGRYIILYNYGGVYHDLKCVTSNIEFVDFLQKSHNNGITFIAEQRPGDQVRVRNTNICALIKHHRLLDKILKNLKTRLLVAFKDNAFGSKHVSYIGSESYRDTFYENESTTIIRHLLCPEYLVLYTDIYKLNYTSWQETQEYIFKQPK
tara:strand:- start:158 stop:853 length:696 start_codon:yes stop_codon:yes gene_type:complete